MVESYDKAILFAKMLNDDVLVKNLELEKEKDLEFGTKSPVKYKKERFIR